jgi:hypothetical protein
MMLIFYLLAQVVPNVDNEKIHVAYANNGMQY